MCLNTLKLLGGVKLRKSFHTSSRCRYSATVLCRYWIWELTTFMSATDNTSAETSMRKDLADPALTCVSTNPQQRLRNRFCSSRTCFSAFVASRLCILACKHDVGSLFAKDIAKAVSGRPLAISSHCRTI